MRKPSDNSEKPCDGVLSFEQALADLELVVRDLEDGRLGLSESLARYEEGVRLLKHCHESLSQAERRIMLLTGVDADGNPITEPFDEQVMSLTEKKDARSRRRSRSNGDGASVTGEISPVMDSAGRELSSADEYDLDKQDMDKQKGLF